MHFRESFIKNLFEITPKLFHDERGFFFESYSQKVFKENGINAVFIQDNQSFSKKNVLRGLHYQTGDFAQGKLVRVIKGKVLDVAVDLRKGSPTYGKHEAVILDDVKCNMLYVPEGFAHGFLAMEETILVYKCTNIYNKGSEGGILWNDPDLNIDWQAKDPIVSEKDRELKYFKQATL
jgi:dTDP-4-dehydrorhamnose 3,5-epimerase